MTMNKGLRNEVAMLLGAAAASVYFVTKKRSKLSTGLAVASTALRLWPAKKESFQDKSVLITGGSRGLGLELARLFADEGDKVAILARDPVELKKAADILESHARIPSYVLPIVCDITNKEQTRDAYYEVCDKFKGVDVLVNNAGSILVGPAKTMNREDYMAQLELHLFANMRLTELMANQHGCAQSREENKSDFDARYLNPRKKVAGPRIVNIISMGGKVGVPHMLPYDVSKFALAGYSQGMRSELSLQGISVTSVYPALMQTGSPIQAVFKGDHEKEFSWFASADNFPGLSMDAEKAASLIIEGARRRDAELILSSLGRVREIVNAFLPETMASVMTAFAALMPSGQSDDYKTGASSSRDFNTSKLTKSLSKRAKKTAKKNNQKPKSNAAFNLGLN